MLRFFTPTIPVSVKMALANGGVLFRRKALAQGRSLQSVSFAGDGISARLVAAPAASVPCSVLLATLCGNAEQPRFSRQRRTLTTRTILGSGGAKQHADLDAGYSLVSVNTAVRSSSTVTLSVFALPFVASLPQRGWPASNVRISSVQSVGSHSSKPLRGIRATKPSTAHENVASRLETKSAAAWANSTHDGRAAQRTMQPGIRCAMPGRNERWSWSTVLLWRGSLVVPWSVLKRFTTATGSARIIDQRTLNCGSSGNPEDSAQRISSSMPDGFWRGMNRSLSKGDFSSRVHHASGVYSLA